MRVRARWRRAIWLGISRSKARPLKTNEVFKWKYGTRRLANGRSSNPHRPRLCSAPLISIQSKSSVLAKHLGGDAMCVVRRRDSAIKSQEQQYFLNLLRTAPVFERPV